MLEFGTSKDGGWFVVTTRPKIYINPAVDTVCLPRPDSFLCYMTSQGSDYFGNRDKDFATQVARMKLKSLAINVSRREGLAINNGTEATVYGGILPTNGDALEELILFSDPRYYNSGDEGSETQDCYDMVSFQNLPEDEKNGMIEDLGHLDCYYLPASNLCKPERIARYNSWKKVLCKVDGRFEIVED
ncbi:hypothetical protein BDZ45DRAFT_729164 [Acephala macrosclerotiorum]|nr:hypothetical protein BDZ45DRAFT_729164 [Acephala macrosclerotiorum]